MELIGFNGTHVTRLFNVMRRGGAVPLPRTMEAIEKRYKFAVSPKGEDLLGDKFFFRGGEFGDNAIDSFELYSDGVIARGRCHSDVLDAFLEDADKWLSELLEARVIETHDVSRNYESSLTVRASDKLFASLEPLERASAAVSKLLKKTNNSDVQFYPFGFTLSPEDTKVVGLRPAQFRLERKLGTDMDKGLFVSTAPLRTDDHLALLAEIEKSLAR